MNLRLFLAVLALTGAIAGCELLSLDRTSNEDPRVVALSAQASTVEIAYGETVAFEESNLRLTFEAVEDSRCPMDVVCIWEGEATVGLRLKGPDATSTLELKIPGLVEVPYERGAAVTAGGYDFRLVQLLPYPSGSAPSRQSAYRATLQVEPAE